MKISVAMSALNLSGMRVVGFGSFPVTGQTGWRCNTELLGQVITTCGIAVGSGRNVPKKGTVHS
jgi:hypothetical protein